MSGSATKRTAVPALVPAATTAALAGAGREPTTPTWVSGLVIGVVTASYALDRLPWLVLAGAALPFVSGAALFWLQPHGTGGLAGIGQSLVFSVAQLRRRPVAVVALIGTALLVLVAKGSRYTAPLASLARYGPFIAVCLLRAGARGYLTKDASGAEISRALHDVLGDRAVIDPAVQHHLVDAIAADAPGSRTAPAKQPAQPLPGGLTPREAEVLGLIARGLPNAEIAEKLVVSEATVKSHINHLLPKINARDRAQAVTFAYQNGLVSPTPDPNP